MTFFIIQKSLWEFIEYQSTYLRAVVLEKNFFANRSSIVAHAERIIKWTTLMPSWIFILRVMKRGSRQFQKLQMKNTNWSFNILMIFHEFSLLNFLWSCRNFILFSIFKITHFLKLEIFSRSQFLKIENFWKNFPRRQGG